MNADLKKGLGLVHLFSVATGAMISSGLFVLPGLAHAKAGPAAIVSYFLAGLLAAVGMLNIAELTSAMPRAGGDYFFISRSLGPAVGTVSGLLTWFSLSLKSTFALVGMAAFSRLLFGQPLPLFYTQCIALALCVVFIGLNLLGSREAATLQVWLTVFLLVALGVYITAGLRVVDPANLDPVAPQGLPAVVFTAGFVFVSYGGLLKVSSIAEEVRNPGRMIPLAMILSLLIVSALYTLTVLVTTGVLPGGQLDNSLTPISDGARVFMGKGGAWFMAAAAIAAFVSTANAGLLSASRYLLALSRDELLPGFLGKVNERFQTPHFAIAVTGTLMAISVFLNLHILVEAASTVLILSYSLSCLCVVVLHESRLQNYRPSFRAPFYPWLQILGVLGFALLIVQMGLEAYIISAVLIVIGFSTYWVYGRGRRQRDFALLHVIERLTSAELVTGMLENELKQIVRERDQIQTDRFDRLVETCPVLDIDRSLLRSEFLERASVLLAPRLRLPAEQIQKRLIAREHQGSTALTPTIAIPHIVMDESIPFDMLITRCFPGVRFDHKSPAVSCIVVFVGSREDRNFHLRCLAAIAQTVQAPDFEERWRQAKGEQGLRDIFLLANRRR